MSDQDQTNPAEQHHRHREPEQAPQARTTPTPAANSVYLLSSSPSRAVG